MKRREFLKNLFGVAAVAAMPLPVLASLLDESVSISEVGNIQINWNTQTISVTGNQTYTVQQLYAYLRDIWITEEPILSVESTSNIIELYNDWKFDSKAMQVIKNGTVLQNGEMWTCLSSVLNMK